MASEDREQTEGVSKMQAATRQVTDTRSILFRTRHWFGRRSFKDKVRMELLLGIVGIPLGWLVNVSITGVSTPEKAFGDFFLWVIVAIVWFAVEVRWLWKSMLGY